MADDLAAIREELSLANRILAHEGIVDAFGHISVRHPGDPGRFLISRHRAPATVRVALSKAFRITCRRSATSTITLAQRSTSAYSFAAPITTGDSPCRIR